MVQKRQSEADMQDNEKKLGNKFFYQNKRQKANPWDSFDKDSPDDLRKAVEKPNFTANSSRTSELNSLPLNSNFDLDSVWSVRKNVPLASNKKQINPLNLQTGNSYYSRHAGGLIGSHHNKTEATGNSSETGNSSWQMKKPGYSYTSQGSLKRQADDDDDEFDFGETKKKGNFQNDVSPSQVMQHPAQHKSTIQNKGSIAGLINPIRKGSARTQRAQKMHEAYLRSAGLGLYAANDPFHGKNEDDVD